ncbi:related to thymidylate kinase [Phialocephala subalpina]|uniref:Thymidylate kinase n=1 Tax=Phialocephala subalpina TaxID=576137 RepID=A0A1L7WUL1_9HELO|nr:related to thymidylate kinase [Phialocephala subalpina]
MTSEESFSWQEPRNSVVRGAFVVVEGLDRAGKTTQVQRLCSKLYALGHNIKTLRFPDRNSTIGQMISSYLQNETDMDDHVIHLLFSANRWEKAKWIEETLSKGYTIICDRYFYSGMVYSAAKQNPSLSLSWTKHPEIGLPLPDVVVFLDLEPWQAEQRGGYGEEKYEKREMQLRVRELFLQLLKADDGRMKIVNAGDGMDAVEERIWKEVLPCVEAVEGGSFGVKIGKFKG